MADTYNIDTLAALEAAATPGEWSERCLNSILRYARKNSGYWDDLKEDFPDDSGIYPDDSDAKFIAAARNALPAMIADLRDYKWQTTELAEEVHRLGEENDKMREMLRLYQNANDAAAWLVECKGIGVWWPNTMDAVDEMRHNILHAAQTHVDAQDALLAKRAGR